MQQIQERLNEMLILKDPGLVGCRRRNLWQTEDQTVWRKIRGNSLMALIGRKETAFTPVGDVEFFHFSEWLLFFRGGSYNAYWLEDFIDVWSLAMMYSVRGEVGEISRNVILFQEDHGTLTIHTIPIPEHIDPGERVAAIIKDFEADPPGRIPKNDVRALRVCRWCPVRVRCNARDVLDGKTDDWSPDYRASLR